MKSCFSASTAVTAVVPTTSPTSVPASSASVRRKASRNACTTTLLALLGCCCCCCLREVPEGSTPEAGPLMVAQTCWHVGLPLLLLEGLLQERSVLEGTCPTGVSRSAREDAESAVMLLWLCQCSHSISSIVLLLLLVDPSVPPEPPAPASAAAVACCL